MPASSGTTTTDERSAQARSSEEPLAEGLSGEERLSRERPAPGRFARWVWAGAGLLLVGIGTLGVFLPVLPTTVFFIGAAACFARSSPRLERWVLDLPHVGPLVQDYRDGLGMPRRVKVIAIAAIAIAVTLSALALPSWLGRAGVAGLGLIGIAYIVLRVPTRERVLAQRSMTQGR